MNSNWNPIAILPNLSAKEAVEGDVIALAPCHDPRVVAFCTSQQKFKELISQFTDAFRVPLDPVVLIVRDDVMPLLAQVEPLASFRDLVALSVIPYARSLGIVYKPSHRISYSNSFWLYPWTLSKDNEHLVASTPAFQGFHVVEEFQGQSSPELPIMELNDVDEPLFHALLLRWKQHYLGKRQRWQNRALFRSLNMAAQASQIPAGTDTTLYDVGRMVSLWVSAFEILAHPLKGDSNPRTVYPLLECVSYINAKVGLRRFGRRARKAKTTPSPSLLKKMTSAPLSNPWPRRPLPCWFYDKLYKARCDFLHGNSVGSKTLTPQGSTVPLFWIAPSLYRLALTGFLGLSFKGKIPPNTNPKKLSEYATAKWRFEKYQRMIERALLRARK